ncbi:hypothetical protein DFJ77DRAFT_173001 [Powellomyces hirtus]|nr:hypothetical protein DFJ77DRAFT_173001 [Powellomyces hirtus]
MQLADAAEKAEKTRARNERTFANVTGQYRRNPNKSGLDRLTLEVVQVYEEKLGEKVREVDELKRKVRGEREASTNGRDIHDNREWRAASRGSSVSRKSSNHNSNKNNGEDNGHEDAVVDIDEELRARGKETDTNKIKIKGNRRPARDSPHDDEDQQSQLARAMGQQVNSLQARLNATLAALQTTQKENDLLQLQLLASKKPEWTNNNNNNNNNIITTTSSTAITTKDRTGLQTRDLIRMDKQAYRLRLYKIDALQVEDARNLLKDVCVRFECDDVHNLPTVLERVEMVMRLVPQMEVFIHHISRAVSAAQMRLVDDQEHDNSHKNEMYQRLPQLSKTVEEWSEKIVDVEMLRGFRTRVHKVLGVSQTRMSEEECLREIARGVAVGRVKQVGNDGGSSSNGGVEVRIQKKRRH